MTIQHRNSRKKSPSLRDNSDEFEKKLSFHSWNVPGRWAFSLLFAIRVCSAVWNNINDCDETFNYWEPSHFLIYNNGFQTWEYSPAYGIRSYTYLWFYMLPSRLFILFGLNKLTIFYLTRLFIASVSALAETILFRSIKETFGVKDSLYFLLVSSFSTGMFTSTTSFLPSSFAIPIICFSFSLWFRKNYRLFVFVFAFGSILSWPFIAVIGFPIALYLFLNNKHRIEFIVSAFGSAIVVLIPTIAIDSYYYGKFVLASLNIILYNVFSSHGPNIYGTEPFSFYLQNLFLNFNIFFLISLLSIPALFLYYLRRKATDNQMFGQIFVISSLHLWYLIFFWQAHKEERFMYPVYPLICMTASFTLTNIQHVISEYSSSLQFIYRQMVRLVFILFLLLSFSRTFVLYKGYYSSLSIYHKFYELESSLKSTQQNETIICLGKEWHRFPSNFFIPSGFKVEFIASEFRGQLPKHFDSSRQYPTRIIPTNMNDMNQEETSRYVDPITKCHYIIDTDYPEYHGRDHPYSKDHKNWSIISSMKYMDHGKSSTLFRAFYVPFFHENRCFYIDYNLLKNKKLS